MTSSTPSGWTLQQSGVQYAAVYVFTKTASSGESSFSTTHNNGDRPLRGIVYEFYAGSTYLDGNSANNQSNSATGPQVTGLAGTYTRFSARSWCMSTSGSTGSCSWTLPTVEDYDTYVPDTGQDGVFLSIAYDDNATGSSFDPSSVASISDPFIVTGEAISFALSVITPNTAMPWLWFADGSTSDTTLNNNLAARYDFSGNANDTSGNGKNGTINGTVTGTTDRHGTSNSAYSFNGSTGYISATLPTTATSNIAISAWFKTSNITNDRQTIVMCGNGGSDGYGVFVNQEGMATGQLMILYGNVTWYATGIFVDTNWHHVVLNIMSDKHPELYLDSVKVYTGTVLTPGTPTGNLGIGNDYSGTATPFFNGALDDIRIYTATLTATQVGELYAM